MSDSSPSTAGGSDRLIYIDDGVPETGTRFLEGACAERGVEFIPVDPRSFTFDPEARLARGDLLYRPAVSPLALRVERFLFRPGVSTFYGDPAGPLFGYLDSMLLFERAGVNTPRVIPCHTSDRSQLRGYAERLGGLPLVVKVSGFSRGVGVVRVDSMESFFSVVDLILAMGRRPNLLAWVPDAIHWRAVVIGDRVVASYRNEPDADDFRTHARRDPEDYHLELPEAVRQAAVKAPAALRLDMGGVDLLQHPSGRVYVLESNFPCYFAQAQEVAGIDVAGAMVDHLLEKRTRLPEADPKVRT